MRCAAHLGLAITCVAVQAAQIPFQPSRHIETAVSSSTLEQSWDLDALPDPDSTAHLVFDTVSSLLQHWPNTRYRNGHNIIPGIVAPGTLLYHGRSDPQIPTIPDWTATDPEHSYLFCRGESNCWHLTLVATRPLQILYFDGSSAAKMRGGPMDSQDILLWGEIKPDWTFHERKRVDELCQWGREFGLDGFVRMEMDFEIMLCDFTAGVETVSFLNLPSSHFFPRRLPSTSAPRPLDRNSTPTTIQLVVPSINHGIEVAKLDRAFEVVHSGSWHNHYPGDKRIQLDLTHLISFYDTSLAPSLVTQRRGKERWDHRLEGIDNQDVVTVKARLGGFLRESRGETTSGVDWETLMRVIADRYGDRLELLKYILESDSETLGHEKDRVRKAQFQLRIILTPYILASAVPPNSTADITTNHTLASQIFKLCATTHTSHIVSISTLYSRLTPSERLLLGAVQDTNREICRVAVRMWVAGVRGGFDQELDQTTEKDEGKKVKDLIIRWKADLDTLMEWLDWSVWVRCKPACGFEHICYLPTWPFFDGGPGGPPRRYSGGLEGGEVEAEVEGRDSWEEAEWERPQPKCIRRIGPYSF